MPITALVMGPAIAIQNSVLASGTSVSICETPPSAKRVMAFHEKAGLCQVDFDLSFLKFSLSLLAEGFSERPGAVKGAFFAA